MSPGRYERARAAGRRNKVEPVRDGALQDDMAEAAECFFADRYGLPRPAFTGPDPGWDFIVANRAWPRCRQLVVDVKWTPYANGWLLVEDSTWEKAISNVFVLVVGTPGRFRLVGYAWHHQFRGQRFEKGQVPCYGLAQDRLHRNVDMLMAAQGYGAAL
jgi:hypothetical protein